MSDGRTDAARAAGAPLLVCMQCGFTHGEFRARGLLGCPACYASFGAALRADMLHIHPAFHKIPASPETAAPEDAAALREQLSDALRHERYEDAAALRARLQVSATAAAPASASASFMPAPAPEPPHEESPAPRASVLAAPPVAWAALHAHDQRLLFVRVTARRNLAGFPFWVSSAPEAAARLTETFRTVARDHGFGRGFRLADASRETLGVLRERMLLPERPASFPGKRDLKLWLPGREPGEHALFGETEHWTRVCLALPPGARHPATREDTPDNSSFVPAAPVAPFDPFDPFARAAELARELARDADDPRFASAPEWGFLTSQPAHAGTGLQFEAGVHLPALVTRRGMPHVARALAAVGCLVEPLSVREPGAAEAGFFRLVSRGGLGLDPDALAARFETQVRRVLNAEARAQDRVTADDATRHEREDLAHRALRVLQEARRMEGPELQLLVSRVRTGVYTGLFAPDLLPVLETTRVRARPFHVLSRDEGRGAGEGEGTGDGGGVGGLRDEARLRAELARRLLSQA